MNGVNAYGFDILRKLNPKYHYTHVQADLTVPGSTANYEKVFGRAISFFGLATAVNVFSAEQRLQVFGNIRFSIKPGVIRAKRNQNRV